MPADIKYFSGVLFWIALIELRSVKLAQSKTNFSTPFCSALLIISSKEPNCRIIIPESNRITGNIGIEYLIFKHRLNIYKEHFQKIEHNLLGQPGAKLKDIKEVYSHAQGLSQCSKFIKENNLAEHIRADTAGSAEMISKTKDVKQED